VHPEKRRRYAIWMLAVSLVLGHVNIGAFAAGWLSHETLDLITNYLSWLAISISALDIVATTDVRVEVD
jgi:hypothetical protein